MKKKQPVNQWINIENYEPNEDDQLLIDNDVQWVVVYVSRHTGVWFYYDARNDYAVHGIKRIMILSRK
jgi:hypothetical protein